MTGAGGSPEASLLGAFFSYRFVRFGVVGLSGTVVNMAVLYLSQNFLFANVHPFDARLRFSLGLAIFLATLNNYLWNRWWTWGDRRRRAVPGFLTQMFQYYMACGVAIFVQFAVTLLLSKILYYLIANIAAIVVSAVFVYILNHIWTFGKTRDGE